MRNFITSASPLALTAYAKSEEGTGQAPNTDPSEEDIMAAKLQKEAEDKIEEEEDPFAGFEVSEEIIGRDVDNKYGWEKFPAPTPKLDTEGKPTGTIRYAGKRIPLDGVKGDSIRGSIKKYQDRVISKGGPKPEFRTTIEKDAKEVPVAIFVQRIK